MYDPERAETLKNQGNEAFKAGEHPKAIELYSQALGKRVE
jgi:hypothetical protein